jgi:ABC-2 type transport system permease protein
MEDSMLANIIRHLRLYKLLVSTQFKILSRYRSDFIVGTICILLTFLSVQFTLWIIFQRIHDIAGWTRNEIIFIYGFNTLVLGCVWVFISKLWILRDELIAGVFLRYKVRPINATFYYFAESLDLKSFSSIALGIAVLVFASKTLGLNWTVGYLLLCVAFVVFSSFLFLGLLLFFSSFGFRYNNSAPLMGFMVNISQISYFPFGIYGAVVSQLLMTVFPVGLISFLPSSILLHKVDLGWNVMTYVAICVASLWLGLFAWSRGTEAYEGSGT